MKISTRGRYGLRLMMELASRFESGPVSVRNVAISQEISGKYIHLLVAGLKSAGLVRAVRGPGGGIELARDPSAITAYEVVAALEGKMTLVDCVFDNSFCDRAAFCAARDLWGDVAEAVNKMLAGITLEHLSKKQSIKKKYPVKTRILRKRKAGYGTAI